MSNRPVSAIPPLKPAIKGGMRGGAGRSRQTNGRTYRPGDTVRQSGIYEVLHQKEHRPTHEVVMVSGDQFPACDLCDHNVRFRLSRAATYIFHDEDFEEFEG